MLLSWLILFSGDVEINPGPIKYPCGECSAPVKSNQYGIQCDVCTNWLHTIYIGLSDDQYAELQQSTDPWSCRNCLRQALPFHNISTSDSIFNTSLSTTSSSDLLQPSLNLSATSHKKYNDLALCHLNVQSLLTKRDEISDYLNHSSFPTVLGLSETWLDGSVSDSEVSINRYKLFRRDRRTNEEVLYLFMFQNHSDAGGDLIWRITTLKPFGVNSMCTKLLFYYATFTDLQTPLKTSWKVSLSCWKLQQSKARK